MNQTVHNIYFSPSGTTETVAKTIAEALSEAPRHLNLLTEKITGIHNFAPDTMLVVSMPVFAGRIPPICVEMLQKFKGNNTPAIAVVVYGNRAYEDALLELTNVLKENGFVIAGAGAFVAQHSIFTEVAQGRPDHLDREKIKDFATRCMQIIENGTIGTVTVPGKMPYREAGAPSLSPSASFRCNQCGACSRICPVGAIPAGHPRVTEKEKCINCTACIHCCPQKARRYRGVKFMLGKRIFLKKCSVRREPEYYVAQ